MPPRMMRGMRPMRMLKPIKPAEPFKDLAEVVKDDEALFKSWADRVGETRAQRALDVWRKRTGSTTLPELLAEAWLMSRGANYETQFDLGWAHPDFVLFNVVPAASVVLEVYGDYWHGKPDAAAHDAMRKAQLLTTTARGMPIKAVVEIWEKDIYAGDQCFEQAYAQLVANDLGAYQA
jgi:hypothetical protein